MMTKFSRAFEHFSIIKIQIQNIRWEREHTNAQSLRGRIGTVDFGYIYQYLFIY